MIKTTEEQPSDWQFTKSFHILYLILASHQEGQRGQVLSFFPFHKWRNIYPFIRSVSQSANIYQARVYSWYNAGLWESSESYIPFLLLIAHSGPVIVSWKTDVFPNKWRWVLGVFCWKLNLSVNKYLNSNNFQDSFKPLILQNHFLFYEQVTMCNRDVGFPIRNGYPQNHLTAAQECLVSSYLKNELETLAEKMSVFIFKSFWNRNVTMNVQNL